MEFDEAEQDKALEEASIQRLTEFFYILIEAKMEEDKKQIPLCA